MELQPFGLMDGEDAYAVHLSAGDCLGAEGFIPIADEAVEVGRVALQIFRHSIEECKQIGILFPNAAHVEQREQFFQQFVQGHQA